MGHAGELLLRPCGRYFTDRYLSGTFHPQFLCDHRQYLHLVGKICHSLSTPPRDAVSASRRARTGGEIKGARSVRSSHPFPGQGWVSLPSGLQQVRPTFALCRPPSVPAVASFLASPRHLSATYCFPALRKKRIKSFHHYKSREVFKWYLFCHNSDFKRNESSYSWRIKLHV